MQLRSFYHQLVSYTQPRNIIHGPYLLRRVALKDAWSTQNVDENGHQPFQEGLVDGASGVSVQAVAQGGRGFHLESGLC